MAGELIDLLIVFVVLAAFFWLVLWFVRNVAPPQFAVPTQVVIAVIALIVILYQLKKFLPALLD